jgi:hypothetical protein
MTQATGDELGWFLAPGWDRYGLSVPADGTHRVWLDRPTGAALGAAVTAGRPPRSAWDWAELRTWT